MLLPSEEDEQIMLVKWLIAKKIFFFAITNENNSHKQNRHYAMIAEKKAKLRGKLKGVSDIAVFLPSKILFIEMKRRPKKLKSGKLSVSHTKVSKEQEEFIERVRGYAYADARACYGFEDAKEFIESHLRNMRTV